MKSPATDQAVDPGSPIPVGETKEVNNEEFFKKYLLKWMFSVQNPCEAIGQLHRGNKKNKWL